MKISVVIPVKNEVDKIRKCLDSLLEQTVKPVEIIVIDSGSTDGTQDVVRSYKEATLVEIPSSEFNHGGTRNRGVKMAKGDYVLFTVQDARGLNNKWIETLVKGFVDEEVVAVSGSQVVPHEKGANPAEWFRSYSEPKIVVRKYTPEEFAALPPAEKRSVCGFDNVNSIYKRDILLAHPFPEVMESEDKMWAKDMYNKGYKLCFNPGARVYHYHTEPYNYVYKRTLLNSYIGYKLLEYIPPIPARTTKQWLSILKSIFTAKGLSIGEKLHWVKYNRVLYRAIKTGITDFRVALEGGEENLEARCKELVKIGLQRV